MPEQSTELLWISRVSPGSLYATRYSYKGIVLEMLVVSGNGPGRGIGETTDTVFM